MGDDTAKGSKTWLVVGASRGIGHELVRQALEKGDRVFATTRRATEQTATSLWPNSTACTVSECDMLSEHSINNFVARLAEQHVINIDYVVLNAGVLKYPNRATEISYDDFAFHLHTNTVGPIICAQRLLRTSISFGSITFISSDSGSAGRFRGFEDGFAAYAASKAALNQMLRHMAAELKRQGNRTAILALHPGEVATDMASDVGLEIAGQMSVQESVSACIRVVESKGERDSGTFWTWENEEYAW